MPFVYTFENPLHFSSIVVVVVVFHNLKPETSDEISSCWLLTSQIESLFSSK